PDGSDPKRAYRLVRDLVARQPSDGRLILMSGTPHQGHGTRFENLLRFLRVEGEPQEKLSGRVIYRTKDDIEDWNGNPVFPQRQVNEPLIVDLGPAHRQWIQNIHDFYRPPRGTGQLGDAKRRAAGWRCAQAMQWAASSPHAGLGYLVRQAIRADWELGNSTLRTALAVLRPYRFGPEDESIDSLFERITKEVTRQQRDADVEDIEEFVDGETPDQLSTYGLEQLLVEGISIVQQAGDEKWQFIQRALLDQAGSEKVVLFAQPIETVSALARYLERATGQKPAIIIGGQSDAERTKEVAAFWRPNGPQYLVSSRAGGEGINLQVARRLIHVDVPWNPMDLEQRVGRIHRFGSRETIIVDTLVVKHSREADAYRIARNKLRLIAATLVEPERFEAVFSRVMCLLSQGELQDVLSNEPSAPFDAGDEQHLSNMVQQGFHAWKEFHDRFGEQEKAIRRENPGLCKWEDVVFFLEELGAAKRLTGHKRQRFERREKNITHLSEDALVLGLPNGQSYVCGEYGEELVYGPDDSITPKVGLNLKSVSELLRKYAFPDQPCGAAYLRWPDDVELPSCVRALPFGISAFLRQTLRIDRLGGWLEQGHSIHCFVTGTDTTSEVTGDEKSRLLRGLFRSSIRKTTEPSADLVQSLVAIEREVTETLRRPSDEELTNQIRHAVTPLFAAIITS
ncbi:MAG TPA: helicase-related protein, partial [Blastocatellia bacterium]|nr:helicase-related protein [Blastocatellia bacterium]